MTNKEIWLYLKARNNIDTESEFAIKSFTVTPSTITQGETVTLEMQVSGGKADYTYIIKGNGNRIVQSTTSEKTLTKGWKPANTGIYTLEAVITDATGKSVSSTITLDVKEASENNSTEMLEDEELSEIVTDIDDL